MFIKVTDYEGQNGLCKYCKRWFKNQNSLAQHQCRCKFNPDRKDYNTLAEYSHNNIKGKTKHTSEQVLKQSITLKKMYDNGTRVKSMLGKPGTWLGRHHTKDQIDKMMASSALKFLSKSKKFHSGTYKGFHCDSSWELAFVIYNLEHDIKFERNFESFPYKYKGKDRYYFPDFIIDNVYYEIKGQYTDLDKAKLNQFPSNKNIKLLFYDDMKPYLNYCKIKYGKDFWKLYDK